MLIGRLSELLEVECEGVWMSEKTSNHFQDLFVTVMSTKESVTSLGLISITDIFSTSISFY